MSRMRTGSPHWSPKRKRPGRWSEGTRSKLPACTEVLVLSKHNHLRARDHWNERVRVHRPVAAALGSNGALGLVENERTIDETVPLLAAVEHDDGELSVVG